MNRMKGRRDGGGRGRNRRTFGDLEPRSHGGGRGEKSDTRRRRVKNERRSLAPFEGPVSGGTEIGGDGREFSGAGGCRGVPDASSD